MLLFLAVALAPGARAAATNLTLYHVNPLSFAPTDIAEKELGRVTPCTFH